MLRTLVPEPFVHTFAVLAQLAVAVSVFYVWIFRFDTITGDFERFGYPLVFRNAVGVVKLVIATLLIVGFWSPAVIPGATLGMAALMLGAQWSHWRVANPMAKRVPSAILLAACALILLDARGALG